MRLVDHQQAGGGGQLGSTLSRKSGLLSRSGLISSTSTAPALDLGGDLVPLVEVGRVDRAGPDAGPGGRLDLVAHQRQQRRDDDGRPAGGSPRVRAAARWPRSRPPTCPSRCAARRAPAAGRRPAPRSPATGPRAAGRASPASRRSTASARSRTAARSAVSTRHFYQRRTTYPPVRAGRFRSRSRRVGRSGHGRRAAGRPAASRRGSVVARTAAGNGPRTLPSRRTGRVSNGPSPPAGTGASVRPGSVASTCSGTALTSIRPPSSKVRGRSGRPMLSSPRAAG